MKKNNWKFIFGGVLIIMLALSLTYFLPGVLAEDVDNNSTLSETVNLPIVGRTSGEGKIFEIKEGDYLNIKIESTQSIKGVFESASGGIVLNFEAASDDQLTQLSITGLLPDYAYHLYVDDLHNHREINTNSEGILVFDQDISTHHLLMVQPISSTKYIRNDATGGSCTTIGNWNNMTKTCTLTMDIAETIQIDASGVTLDGNGHKVAPSVGTTNGIYFKSGITESKVKNITVINSSYGINFYQASNNYVENVTTSNNGNYGILISYNSNGNTISNSKFEKAYCGTQLYQSGSNTFINNTFSGNTYIGVYLYNGSHNNTFTDNQIVSNNKGVNIDNSINNIFTDNTISWSTGNECGLQLNSNANNNQFKDNIIYKNGMYGIKFFSSSSNSSGNLFEHNLISDHLYYGIYGSSAGANIYKNNVIMGNSNAGITIAGATGNTVIGNYVSGSSYGIYIGSHSNTVSGNIVFNNSTGIYTQYANTNIISNNTAKNNTGAGISLGYTSHSNVVKLNTLIANRYGLALSSPANNNQIYNNNILNNTTQVNISSGNTGNIFNLTAPTGGNYWSNWLAPDNNSDGFVDNAYVFTNGRDNLPWTKLNGWAGGFRTTDDAPTSWRNSNFTIALTCKDKNNNNCDQTFYRLDNGAWQNGTAININTEGFHLIEYYSVHQGITEDTKITHALLDKTQPIIVGAPTKPPYWNNWYNATVLVHFTATDALSGIQTPPSDIALSWDGANQSAQGITYDKAGNYDVYNVAGINIDKTPPVTTASFSGEHGSGNWYKSDVTVTLSADDAGSGVVRTEYSFDKVNWQTYTGPFSITNEGLSHFYYRSIDNVDNVESASKTVNTVFSNDLYTYNVSDWLDATYLPGFSGRPQSISACGIQFSGQPLYRGYCFSSTEPTPNANKRRAISYNQNFTLGSDTRVDFAGLPRYGTDGSSPLEIVLYDTTSNNYVRIAARQVSYYNRTVQTEISGFGTRESGSLWADGVWLLFRLESKEGKTKISVLNTNEDVVWSTTYDVNLSNLITNYRLSIGHYAGAGQTYQLSYNPVADDIKIFNTNWVYKSSDINIDKSNPEISVSLAGTQGANDWYISDVEATLIATDNNEIDKIEYSLDGTNWQTYNSSVLLTEPGENTFYYRVFDLAGNMAQGSKIVKIDKTAPTTAINLDGTMGSNDWYVSDIKVTLSPTDNEGGLGSGSTKYSFDNTNWNVYTGEFILSDQETTVYYYSIDLAGNVEEIKSQTIKIDKNPPTTAISFEGTEGNNSWYKSDVAVTLLAEDNEGGLGESPTEYSFDNSNWQEYSGQFTISQEGETTVYYRSRDMAGNQEETKQNTIKVDKTLPMIEGTKTPEANLNGWNKEDVTVKFECSDSGSGIESCSPVIVVSTEGENQNVTGTAVDEAGNTSMMLIENINIDKASPTLNGSRTPDANSNGWNKEDVTVKFECSDYLSGVDSVTGDEVISSEGAGQLREGVCNDKAGNSVNKIIENINIDKTAPTITSARIPDANSNGWNNEDVNVNFECDDNLSGVESCTSNSVVSDEGEGQSVTGTVIDVAGNSSSFTIENINIDKTVPKISGSATTLPNSNGWYNNDVTIGFNCNDELSGIDYCSPDKIISSEGANQSVEGTAGDKADNFSSTIVADINIDKTKPETTDDYLYDGVWTNADASVVLTAQDQLGFSGIEKTKYCLDSEGICDPQTGEDYAQPLEITNEGTTYLRYQSQDKAGNIEEVKQAKIMIDKTAPTALIEVKDAQDSQCNFFFQLWIDNGEVSYDVVHGCSEVSANIDASVAGLKEYKLKLINSNGDVVKETNDSSLLFNFETSESVYTLLLEAYDNAGNFVTTSKTVYEDDDNDVALLSASGGAPDLFDLCPAQIPAEDLNKDGCQDVSGVNIQSLNWCIDAYTGRADTSIYPTSSLTQIGESFLRRHKTWYQMDSKINDSVETKYAMNILDTQGRDRDEIHCSVDADTIKLSSGEELVYTKKDNAKLVYKEIGGRMMVKEKYHAHELSDGSKIFATMKYDERKDSSSLHLVYNNFDKAFSCMKQAEQTKNNCQESCARRDWSCHKECNEQAIRTKINCVKDNNYQIKEGYEGYKTLSLFDLLKLVGHEN